jgi:hypothetical protein
MHRENCFFSYFHSFQSLVISTSYALCVSCSPICPSVRLYVYNTSSIKIVYLEKEDSEKIFNFVSRTWDREQFTFSPTMLCYTYHNSVHVETIAVGKPKLALLLGWSENPQRQYLSRLGKILR